MATRVIFMATNPVAVDMKFVRGMGKRQISCGGARERDMARERE